jgi:hypothetical protein
MNNKLFLLFLLLIPLVMTGCVEESSNVFILPSNNVNLSHMHGGVTTVHTVDVINTWYNLTFNTSLGDIENLGFEDNRTIIIDHYGHYTITFGMGFEDSSASPSSNVGMRIIVNGTELPFSYIESDPTKQNSDFWLEHTTHSELFSGDQLNMQYIADDTAVTIMQDDTWATQGFHAYGYIQEIMM